MVDRFGQDASLDFPGRVNSDDELKRDVEDEAAWLASLAPPKTDAYGGLPGSREKYKLTRTGFFHVEARDGRQLLVDPEGNACFHLGLCAFGPGDDYTFIEGRQSLFEWLPARDGEFATAFHPDKWWNPRAFSFYVANLIRKHGQPYDEEAWAARMIPRVRRWGFNASGAFSRVTQAHKQAGFPYVLTLPLGKWTLGRELPGVRGLFDPFDPATAARIDELFAQEVKPKADDPLLIGWFLENEQAFEDIPKVVPTLRGEQPAKRKLVEMLKAKYATIDPFNAAWGLQLADFAAASDGLPVKTKAAHDDVQAFTAEFLEAYHGLVARAFRKCDPHHMLIGNRWQPGTANNEQLCRIAGKYTDVISLNYYTYAVDPGFLKRLHTWAGNKPFMLSEFYWSSMSDTGLPGGREVQSQRERGIGYRTCVEQAAAAGFVVGIEWFTLIDQARAGRYFEKANGENDNSGIVSVTGRPYRVFLAEAMKTNCDIYSVLFGERKPFMPEARKFRLATPTTRTLRAPRAPGAMAIDGRRDDWPGTPPELIGADRLVLGADAGGVDAAFRLCWDDASLCFMVHVTDPTPMKNDLRGNTIWSADAIELFIGGEKIDQAGPLIFSDRQVLLSAGSPGGKPAWHYANSPQQYPCQLAVVADPDGKGYTVEAAVPWTALDFTPADGATLLFDVAIDDSADGTHRLRQLMWNGIARNSSDRSQWGRVVLGN